MVVSLYYSICCTVDIKDRIYSANFILFHILAQNPAVETVAEVSAMIINEHHPVHV